LGRKGKKKILRKKKRGETGFRGRIPCYFEPHDHLFNARRSLAEMRRKKREKKKKKVKVGRQLLLNSLQLLRLRTHRPDEAEKKKGTLKKKKKKKKGRGRHISGSGQRLSVFTLTLTLGGKGREGKKMRGGKEDKKRSLISAPNPANHLWVSEPRTGGKLLEKPEKGPGMEKKSKKKRGKKKGRGRGRAEFFLALSANIRELRRGGGRGGKKNYRKEKRREKEERPPAPFLRTQYLGKRGKRKRKRGSNEKGGRGIETASTRSTPFPQRGYPQKNEVRGEKKGEISDSTDLMALKRSLGGSEGKRGE